MTAELPVDLSVKRFRESGQRPAMSAGRELCGVGVIWLVVRALRQMSTKCREFGSRELTQVPAVWPKPPWGGGWPKASLSSRCWCKQDWFINLVCLVSGYSRVGQPDCVPPLRGALSHGVRDSGIQADWCSSLRGTGALQRGGYPHG